MKRVAIIVLKGFNENNKLTLKGFENLLKIIHTKIRIIMQYVNYLLPKQKHNMFNNRFM